ncbi:PREDICTED: solute carrier family 25 member 51 [Nicrophorus vespilloides]|uniref:Solute carrier family 25 member 51 n=1 Tax=Nicrophorus vespilloides TaxID=110193 RepID=A0ABM1MT66_NICVS|nr:PREDICTED: solute carrier family 25 member 51 [Nicrophorus vespilloides]
MYVVTLDQVKQRIGDVNWKEFACGWGAAFINITLTYPVYKIIFRQMLDGISASIAVKQLHNEGIYFLYRGMMPPLAQKTISLSIMFGMYEEVRRPLMQEGINPYMAKTIGGIVAGSVEVILMPFERIQTLLADSTYHNHFRNTYHAFRSVGLHYGFREYYRGIVPIILRNGPSNACFFIARDEIQSRLPKSKLWLQKTINEFLCGAVIGACVSSIFYPLNVLKITMQSRLGGPSPSIFVVFQQIYNERGGKLKHLYRGVHVNCLRAFLSWGVMNAAYENMRKLLY